jgi:curli biogenesis system outer membrane secretion channel CsgG
VLAEYVLCPHSVGHTLNQGESAMMQKSFLYSVVLVITLIMGQLPLGAQTVPARPPRMAIGGFEYKGVYHLKDGTGPFVDMLTTAFVKTRKFSLVERARVNEALNEMGLGEAGVVDPENCQKLGSMLKADLILFGSITQASLDEKQVVVGGLTTARQDMRMTVDLRVIDAKTGEIKTAETITQSKLAAKTVNVGGTVHTGSDHSGIVGDLMRDVANEIVRKLVSNIYPIAVTMVREDGSLKVSYGEPMLKVGSVYNVFDADGFKTGKILISDVQSKESFGKVISGTVRVGMTCKLEAENTAQQAREQVQEIPW